MIKPIQKLLSLFLIVRMIHNIMKPIFAILIILTCSLSLFAQDNNDNEVAMQYYQNGDFQKASMLFGKLLFNAKNEAYLDLYFNSLLKSKQYDIADKAIKKLIRQSLNL